MTRKVFVAGEVLDAADLNVVVDQSVMSFASESARNTAIPFPVEGMVVYLEDSNNIRIYNGSAWVALPVGSGGTGATTLASGGYLKGAGTSAITSQSGIPASDITSGTLPVARGGTGFSDTVLPYRVAAAVVAGVSTSTITFPVGRFTATPVVSATSLNTANIMAAMVPSSISTSGFSVVNFDVSGTIQTSSMSYIAVQM
jgi:hypothetical protein